MDPNERTLLETTLRSALTNVGTRADAALFDLGWLELLDAEPRAAIEIVFGALGTTNAAATVLDDVVVSALGVQPRADLAVLLPSFGAWDPPEGVGLATSRVTTARELLVVGTRGAVLAPTSSAEVRAVQGVDPDAGLHVVRVEPIGAAEAVQWESAVAAARRALAHQIAGASRAMLGLARTHAVERVQFGRPISSFQAVRHRLADALVAVEALEATLDAADDEPNAMTAALAKATAGRTAEIVASHCQQVLAGIGFTTDHPFHRLLKRTMALAGLFGSADEITVDLGRQLIAARRVPTLIEL